jgi:hypothetical protein
MSQEETKNMDNTNEQLLNAVVDYVEYDNISPHT